MYYSEGTAAYKVLNDIIKDESLWESENSTEKIDPIQFEKDEKDNFLKIIRKEYDEVIFSNLLSHYFLQKVYSGSEATVFHLVKLFSLQQILKHDYPIVVDLFRAEDLSTGKEEIVLEISRSIGNQVILTTTLKHEELGKYDSVEGINHIDYLSHTPSKILDGRYMREFLNLLSSLSIIVQR